MRALPLLLCLLILSPASGATDAVRHRRAPRLPVGACAEGPFSDVPAGHWSYSALAELADAGISIGYGLQRPAAPRPACAPDEVPPGHGIRLAFNAARARGVLLPGWFRPADPLDRPLTRRQAAALAERMFARAGVILGAFRLLDPGDEACLEWLEHELRPELSADGGRYGALRVVLDRVVFWREHAPRWGRCGPLLPPAVETRGTAVDRAVAALYWSPAPRSTDPTPGPPSVARKRPGAPTRWVIALALAGAVACLGSLGLASPLFRPLEA